MKRIHLLIAFLLFVNLAPLRADEGMWLPALISQRIGDMQQNGFRLTAEDIYSVNQASLKDAVLLFGGGCTGELVSDEGLLLTNHHCGYSYIQRHSSVEHDYLRDGFWAMSKAEELPNKGLTVSFLERMEDVTGIILKGYKPSMSEARRDTLIRKNTDKLVKQVTQAGKGLTARVEALYYGNQYFLFVYKVYRDVRLVGAPPSSIGKFGGETDNWMWPRHTGDFSMFRVYAGADNEPADFAPENRPYQPKKHLKISLKGLKSQDYTMILGYPGRTQRFQTAPQLAQMIATNRIRIDARTLRQGIMWEAMCADPDVQLKYANKYASSANGWKKWQGEELAFEKLDIIGREQRKEAAFMDWVAEKRSRIDAYGGALTRIQEAVKAAAADENAITLITEVPFRIELVTIASRFAAAAGKGPRQDNALTPEALKMGLEAVRSYYRDYVPELDRKEAAALLAYYREQADSADFLQGLGEDFATMDIPAYVDKLFSNSVFTSAEKLGEAINGEQAAEVIAGDPASLLHRAVIAAALAHYPNYTAQAKLLQEGSRQFAAGLLEWEKGQPSYPDANSTMRLTWGHVLPYSPKDAVLYRHYSTLTGVMEKEDPENPEFIVPARLKELYRTRDFGPYADAADGMVHTCFLTNNDITGGNSGSPVLNADGELVGLAFDGNWESMSSDVMFEPDLQRCICVDIRYVLFLVDRFGGAPHIVKELDIVK